MRSHSSMSRRRKLHSDASGPTCGSKAATTRAKSCPRRMCSGTGTARQSSSRTFRGAQRLASSPRRRPVASGPLVVALRPLWLGDLLTAIPALRALRDRFSDHRVILAAPAVLAPLARLAEAVDDVVSTRPHAALHQTLHGADVAVDLHGRGPASHRILLETRPRRLVAFEHPAIAESAGLPKWREEEHEVQRWCRLLAESGIPADPHRLGLDRRRFPAPASLAGATLIHPGAKSPARR